METEYTQAEGKRARGPAARRPTIDHVTLWAGDLPASRRFYEAALAPLSLSLEFEHEDLGAEAQVPRRLLRRLRVRP
jgi:hypothetical protein